MKIGILGGTFDPVHMCHLIVAEQAREHLSLDEVWFIPSQIPPHKEEACISGTHRLRMLERAVENNPFFFAKDIELRREGPSYTIDTMKELRRAYPDDAFYFIVGGDMIDTLHEWKGIGELVKLVRFVGLARPGYRSKPDASVPVELVTMPSIDISSSMIRERMKRGLSVRYLVPDPVYQYMKEHRLYE